MHKSVDIEINRNVHRQKCAFARPPKVTKLCKARLGHFSVDWYNFTFLSNSLKNVLVVYEYFCLQTWNLGSFHEMRKFRNIETHLVHRLGPRTGAEVRKPSLGAYMGFNFLIFLISWIPPKVLKFLCKIFAYTIKIIKKSMNSVQEN